LQLQQWLSAVLTVWKNGQSPKAILKAHWDVLVRTACASVKVSERLDIVPDGKESELDVHFNAPDGTPNLNVQVNEAVGCRRRTGLRICTARFTHFLLH
jgi:hypothetical protein